VEILLVDEKFSINRLHSAQ